MKDIIVKAGCTYVGTAIGSNGEELEVTKSLDDLLPVDMVVTIDNNGYVSLYDTCILIKENMIEREL